MNLEKITEIEMEEYNKIPPTVLNQLFFMSSLTNKREAIDVIRKLLARIEELEIDATNLTMDYLELKYKGVPQLSKYIKTMTIAGVSLTNIDLCLDVLIYKKDKLLLQAVLGTALAEKLFNIQQELNSTEI